MSFELESGNHEILLRLERHFEPVIASLGGGTQAGDRGGWEAAQLQSPKPCLTCWDRCGDTLERGKGHGSNPPRSGKPPERESSTPVASSQRELRSSPSQGSLS